MCDFRAQNTHKCVYGLGELTAFPRPPRWVSGGRFATEKGVGEKGRGGERRGAFAHFFYNLTTGYNWYKFSKIITKVAPFLTYGVY